MREENFSERLDDPKHIVWRAFVHSDEINTVGAKRQEVLRIAQELGVDREQAEAELRRLRERGEVEELKGDYIAPKRSARRSIREVDHHDETIQTGLGGWHE